MPLTGLLLIGSSLAATTDLQAGAGRPSEAQCDAAWAYTEMEISALGSRPLVFSTRPLFLGVLPPNPAPRGSWYSPQEGQATESSAPPPALLDALTNRNMVPACPSIGQRLAARHIRYGDASVQWATAQRPRGGSYRAAIISISLPAVSPDGRHAVLGVTSAFGPLGGGGRLIHLVRAANGRWREAGWRGLWIS